MDISRAAEARIRCTEGSEAGVPLGHVDVLAERPAQWINVITQVTCNQGYFCWPDMRTAQAATQWCAAALGRAVRG